MTFWTTALLRLYMVFCLLLVAGCARYFSEEAASPEGRDSGGDLAAADASRSDRALGPDTGPRGDALPNTEGGSARDLTVVDLFIVPDGGCPAGTSPCDDECVDLTSDPRYCGKCDRACGAGQDCVNSSCTCIKNGNCDGCCNGDACLLAGTTEQTREKCGDGGHTCKKCSDGLGCTGDACVAGGCVFDLLPDTCLIDSACRAKKEPHPEMNCAVCHPAVQTDNWDILPGCVFTVAGTGVAGNDDGPPLSANFFAPTSVASYGLEKHYVTDRGNNVIRQITETAVSTFAGTGSPGFLDGPVAAAMFASPESLVVDKSGVIYVADTGNSRIRTINGGVVSTLTTGLASPSGVALGGDGRVYVADVAAHQIFVIDPSTGSGPVLLAGTGTPGADDGAALSASFNGPVDLAVDINDAVYVADTGNSRIRVIAGGQVTTLAGSGAGFLDGPALSAKFAFPEGIAVSSDGEEVFVADSVNNCIRRINLGEVITFAGSGAVGKANGPAATATFNNPTGVTMLEYGWIGVADRGNHLIRGITPP